MSDQLAKDLQEKANVSESGSGSGSGSGQAPAKKFNFNFNAAAKPAFTPGQFNPGQFSQYGGGAAGGYSQYGGGAAAPAAGGYQDYRNYASTPAAGAAAEPEPESNTLTLDQYKQQNKGSLNTRGPSAKKVLSVGGAKKVEPKVLKIGGASSKQSSPAPAKEASPAPAKETKELETAKEQAKDIKEEAKPEPKVVKEETKPKEEVKDHKAAAKTAKEVKEAKEAEKVDADAVVKEQEKLDSEIVEDMFGDQNVKEHMSIIFMGHVDAGKSTMGGNLLFLTGSVDKRTVEKYEREAIDAGRQGWYLSWVMDTNKEERNEGKTIEVGRAVFETDKRRYTILDAPGHKMYVPSMIGGASQADIGILVISARRGEYETGFEKGGQTREHAVLAKTQGVDRLVVVVNKMDDPTVAWSKERYDECTKKLGVFLKATGYTDVTFMPVSGYTGAGLKEPVPKDECPWYSGPTLLDFLDNSPVRDRRLGAPFMLPVSGKSKDLGTIVEGKIEAGTVKKGSTLLMMPNRTSVEVTAIYNESEAEIPGALSGEQVKLKLKGIEEEDIQIGFVLTSAKNPIKAVTRFEAQVAIVEIKSILTAGFSCVMHVHTAVEEVTFVKLLHKLEKGTNRKSKKPPAFAKKGMKIIAVLETDEPVCVEEFSKLPQLGRFTLRDQGQTIAIGKVTKILD